MQWLGHLDWMMIESQRRSSKKSLWEKGMLEHLERDGWNR